MTLRAFWGIFFLKDCLTVVTELILGDMMMCTRTPKPGQKTNVRNAPPLDLPRGLSDDQEVTVVSDKENAGLTVEDESGARYRIPIQCVESEHIYFAEGRWRRERHPLVLEYFRKTVEELERTRARWPCGTERIHEQNLARFRQVLERHASE